MTIAQPRHGDETRSLPAGMSANESELTAGVRIEPGRNYGFFTDTSLCIGCSSASVATMRVGMPPEWCSVSRKVVIT